MPPGRPNFSQPPPPIPGGQRPKLNFPPPDLPPGAPGMATEKQFFNYSFFTIDAVSLLSEHLFSRVTASVRRDQLLGMVYLGLVLHTLWCQLEDMFQLIVMLQGIEKVTIQLIDTPTNVYAIGARLFYQRCP